MYSTLAYHTLTPLLPNSIPLVIDLVFKLSAADPLVLYALAELGLNTLDLYSTPARDGAKTPSDSSSEQASRISIVKQLQKVQDSGGDSESMVDGVYRVIKEEDGCHKRVSCTTRTLDDQIINMTVQDRPWYPAWGVCGLYTALGTQFAGNLGVFAVGAVTNIQEEGANEW
ncbi:hypothetical protein BGX31_003766 [Mortierella sp. GBA43]|nr:hypothetical protein BGX31_003766 [Mortierella sp. GBA43]